MRVCGDARPLRAATVRERLSSHNEPPLLGDRRSLTVAALIARSRVHHWPDALLPRIRFIGQGLEALVVVGPFFRQLVEQ